MDNKERKDVKVYLHLRNDTNEIFYIGIGIENRPFVENGRSSYWKNTARLSGYTVKIVAKNLSWKAACKLEIHLIKKYGRKDLGLGNRGNLGGTSWNKGKKTSPETILKRLETRKRNTNSKVLTNV